MEPDFVFGVNSHSPELLEKNLAQSPCLASFPLEVEWNAQSAAIGYNRILDRTKAKYAILIHHDVYLPNGWDRLLRSRISELDRQDPNWAILGAYGVAEDNRGQGPVWSSSIGSIVGRVGLRPVPTISLDEMLIVVKTGSGLRFDERLEGWHLYGTDIVQSARVAGYGAYAGGLPCIHNDGFKGTLGDDYRIAYDYLRHKLRDRLPIKTPIFELRRNGFHFWRGMRRMRKSMGVRQSLAFDTQVSPETLAAMCGWSELGPVSACGN